MSLLHAIVYICSKRLVHSIVYPCAAIFIFFKCIENAYNTSFEHTFITFDIQKLIRLEQKGISHIWIIGDRVILEHRNSKTRL